jgi:hypothetical protein
MFVCEHDCRIANPDLCVADFAIRARHTHQFGGAECTFVEIDSGGSAFDNEIGSDRVITVWNRFGRHAYLSFLAVDRVKALPF